MRNALLGVCFTMLTLAALGRLAGAQSANVPPKPVARIVPGGELVAVEGAFKVSASGNVKREAAKGAPGEAISFGADGKLSWEADGLIDPDRGSILMDVRAAGSTEPVLVVADARKQPVLSLGSLSAARPPYGCNIPRWLNENEGGWLRTVFTWERLDAERMYVRLTVNDRTGDRGIAPAFPKDGPFSYTVAPSGSQVREIAFFDRPLPKQPHPHITRAPSANAKEESARRLARISEGEQALLDARGGVAVLVPQGAQTQALLSGLRTMGLTRFRIVGDDEVASALPAAAVLILPDNDKWTAHAGRDAAVKEYVRAGGGLLALGAGALEAKRLGLANFDPVEAGMEGRTHVSGGLSPALRDNVAKAVLGGSFSAEVRSRRGPLFVVPPDRSGEVVGANSLTRLPCILALRAGNGRVVLASVFPFSYYFCHPVFENVWNVERNAQPYILFKALLFHAAGVPFTARPPEDRLVEPAAVPVVAPGRAAAKPMALALEKAAARLATIEGALRGAKVSLRAAEPTLVLDENASARFEGIALPPRGALGFWLKADTLTLAGAEPRSLLYLSGRPENALHLFYDPRDQFLVLSAVTPNEEYLVMANERTSWDGKSWRHVGVTWRPTSVGDAAVEMFIDGRLAATGGLPLPTRPWEALVLGATPGMTGLACSLRDLAIVPEPRLDLAAVQAAAAPPITWEDTPEESAFLQEFVRTHKLAVLGEDHPGSFGKKQTHEVYGLKFDVLMEKDFLAGRLEKGGYSVLYAPGGGLPEFKNDPKACQDQIRDFVRSGGGFVGICAGLFEASSHYPPEKSANLFKTPLAPFSGCELVDLVVEGRHPVLRGVAPTFHAEEPYVRFMHMSGAALKVEAPGADMKPVLWLGMAPELAAAGSFTYGKGRGVAWCPHPELPVWSWWRASDRTRQVMRRLFRNSIYYAAGVPPPPRRSP